MSTQSIYLIHGDEPYYASESLSQLKSKFSSHAPTYLEDTINLDELFQLCSSASLFTTQSLIILSMPHFLFKAPSEKDLNTLISCLSLAQENQHIIVAVCPGKKVDMRKKAAQLFKKQGEVIEHKTLNQWEQDKLFGFMSTFCQKQSATITNDAMVALESCSGNSLSVLSQCLDTLLTYIHPETTITDSDVKTLYHGEESSLFQLGEALKKAKVQSLSHCLKALLKSNEPPVRILATLHNQFKLYYQLRLLESKNESEASMAKILKKHPFFLKTLRRELSRTYTLSTLKKCLYLVRDADLNLKTGRQAADTAVQYCVMAISMTLK